MFLEKWKDTAFGTDYGMDFLDFLESFDDEILTLNLLYKESDLETFLTDWEKNVQNKNFDLEINISDELEQFVHCEEAIIALSAVIIEALANGVANTKVAYGNKILKFKITNHELLLVKKALTNVYLHPSKFNLFDMIDNEEKDIVLNDISEMIEELETLITSKRE